MKGVTHVRSRARTWQVYERQVSDIPTGDLKTDEVFGESKLAIRVSVSTIEEVLCGSMGVQYGTLSTTNTFLDFGLIEDGRAKTFRPCLTERSTFLICDETEGDNTLPRPVGMREATFRRTSKISISSWTKMKRLSRVYSTSCKCQLLWARLHQKMIR
jgi:hypothetical protein